MTNTLKGAAASPGIVVGPVHLVEDAQPDLPDFDDPAAALSQAVAGTADQLRALGEKAAAAGRDEASKILGAQALMAEDPMLTEAVTERLDSGASLGDALDGGGKFLSDMLAAMDDPYLAARSADVLEVARRVRAYLAGVEVASATDLTEPAIIVAPELTAADTAQMDPDLVLGFVTEQGGPTGHVAVIARALGIPAVVGTAGATAAAACR